MQRGDTKIPFAIKTSYLELNQNMFVSRMGLKKWDWKKYDQEPHGMNLSKKNKLIKIICELFCYQSQFIITEVKPGQDER